MRVLALIRCWIFFGSELFGMTNYCSISVLANMNKTTFLACSYMTVSMLHAFDSEH